VLIVNYLFKYYLKLKFNIYIKMSLNNNQDSVTFELEYKATNDSQIKLFGSDFVKRNIDKCKIILSQIYF